MNTYTPESGNVFRAECLFCLTAPLGCVPSLYCSVTALTGLPFTVIAIFMQLSFGEAYYRRSDEILDHAML